MYSAKISYSKRISGRPSDILPQFISFYSRDADCFLLKTFPCFVSTSLFCCFAFTSGLQTVSLQNHLLLLPPSVLIKDFLLLLTAHDFGFLQVPVSDFEDRTLFSFCILKNSWILHLWVEHDFAPCLCLLCLHCRCV